MIPDRDNALKNKVYNELDWAGDGGNLSQRKPVWEGDIELKHKSYEGANHMKIWGKINPGRVDNRNKGLELGINISCLDTRKKSHCGQNPWDKARG